MVRFLNIDGKNKRATGDRISKQMAAASDVFPEVPVAGFRQRRSAAGEAAGEDGFRIRPRLRIPGQSPTFHPVPCCTPRDTEPVPTEHKAA